MPAVLSAGRLEVASCRRDFGTRETLPSSTPDLSEPGTFPRFPVVGTPEASGRAQARCSWNPFIGAGPLPSWTLWKRSRTPAPSPFINTLVRHLWRIRTTELESQSLSLLIFSLANYSHARLPCCCHLAILDVGGE